MSAKRGIRKAGGIAAVVAALVVTGCGGSGGPSPMAFPPVSPGTAATPSTIAPLSDPGTTNGFLAFINAWRAQAFGDALSPLTQSDVLYTAATRHAAYLDSINSTEGVGGPDAENVTVENELGVLFDEPVAPTLPDLTLPVTRPIENAWPALFTNNDLRRRILAVLGGGDLLLENVGAATVHEAYIFNSNYPILDPNNSNALSQFRSVARSQFGSIDYNDAENFWYHPLWRIPLMRASSQFIGVGTVTDGRSANDNQTPPFPLFDSVGGFGATATIVEYHTPVTVTRESIWPNNGNSDVLPWGLDGTQDGATHPFFSGPPMHVTVPTTEPFSTVTVELCRVDGEGSNTIVDDDLIIDETGTPASVDGDGDAPDIQIYTSNGSGVAAAAAAGGCFEAENDGTLFDGTGGGGTGGGGGTTEVDTVLESNLGIRFIDHFNDGDGPASGDDGTDPLFPPAEPQTVGAPQTTVIELEQPLSNTGNLVVQVGDTITTDTYPSPRQNDPNGNPGGNQNIISSNANQAATIAFISPNRRFIGLQSQIGSGIDENSATTWNILGQNEGNESNGTLEITGLRPPGATGNAEPALRNGEILAIPEDPLLPGTWFRLTVTYTTIAQGVGGTHVVWFRTRNSPIPARTSP